MIAKALFLKILIGISFFIGFIQSNEPQPAIEIVDLYQMFCHLLNIKPAENDGVWDRIRALLRNSSSCLNCSNIVLFFTSFVLLWLSH